MQIGHNCQFIDRKKKMLYSKGQQVSELPIVISSFQLFCQIRLQTDVGLLLQHQLINMSINFFQCPQYCTDCNKLSDCLALLLKHPNIQILYTTNQCLKLHKVCVKGNTNEQPTEFKMWFTMLIVTFSRDSRVEKQKINTPAMEKWQL